MVRFEVARCMKCNPGRVDHVEHHKIMKKLTLKTLYSYIVCIAYNC